MKNENIVAGELLDEIKAQQEIIINASKKIAELSTQLKELPFESFMWIPVKAAANKFDISSAYIYNKINSKALDARHFGAKKYINQNQLEALMN